MDWRAKIIPELAGDATTFAYSRPGSGESDPVSTPRDGQGIIHELRSLLRSLDLPPPYVLVGHSLGGLYTRLFARRYPDDVRALILVDSTHPQPLKGYGSPEHRPFWVRAHDTP